MGYSRDCSGDKCGVFVGFISKKVYIMEYAVIGFLAGVVVGFLLGLCSP